MRMRAAAITVTVGMMAILFVACDLFSTRSTESPLDSGSPWIQPTQVEIVFQNMIQAIAELNSDHYLRCFFSPDNSDLPFLFVPNPSVTGWPISEPWGYEEEQQTIEYLFSLLTPESPGFLAFSQVEAPLVYGNEDSVRVTQEYNLVVPVSDPTLPQEVSGKADFYLAKTDIGYWAIYRWEDVEGSPSWTELKAGLY